MIENILEIAKRNGSDVGTWDKSGNGVNLISFKTDELQAFVADINQQLLSERNECVEEIKRLREVMKIARGYANDVDDDYIVGLFDKALSITDSIKKLLNTSLENK